MDKQGIFYEIFDTTEKEWDAEQWRETGKELRHEYRAGGKKADQWKWKLGDWLLTGQNNLGERKARFAVKKIWNNTPWGTLKNFRWVSSVFPDSPDSPSRRRDGVSWEHHRIIAALPEHKRAKELDHCEKLNPPIRKFKAGLKAEMQAKEEFADLQARMKGEFPLFIDPIAVTFPSHRDYKLQSENLGVESSAALLYLFESEQATHGKQTRGQFVVWLIEKGVESLGWMPKVKEFAALRKEQRKARQEDIAKRDAEAEARRIADEANFKARKAAWEQSRSGTSNQT